LCAFLSLLVSGVVQGAHAAEKKEFKVAWSIYTGYMPLAYAERAGILKKWADKYGIQISLVQINDYIESINQYTAGQFDAVADTTMDTLTIPSAGGVDSSVIIMGDYSNGNDAIFIKGKGKTLADLKGQKIHLVQYSISHYMLDLALKKAGLKPSDVETTNIADADFVAAFGAPEVQAVVVWNPATTQIAGMANASQVFSSSEIPGELQDVIVAKTDTVRQYPQFAKALTGAWFEALAVMRQNDAASVAARTFMAKLSGTDLADFDNQVTTTHLYYEPADALKAFRDPAVAGIMERTRTFCFENGLFGNTAKSRDAIGIELADGKILGDKSNVKLRFDATFTALAAEGKL
jgi:NitT/TauT family transport system substrate-binding protein